MAQTRKVGKTATVIGHDGDMRYTQYHATRVVEWTPSEINLNTGGWFTQTTRNRMNQTANEFSLGFYVYQKAGEWFAVYNDQTIAFNGNTLTLPR